MLEKLSFLFGKGAGFAVVRTFLATRRRHSPLVPAVLKQADTIADILDERGCALDRIGIDGVPGSGKSTLARALAAKLSMKWKSLDHQNFGLPESLDHGRTIYEHHRLFRTVDVDALDAIIYIDEPINVSLAKLSRRRRGQVMAAVLDFNRMKKIGEIAFDICEGEAIPVPGTCLIIKIRPEGGFRVRENIDKRLLSAELKVSGLKKEEMLFLLAYGRRRYGLQAYFVPYAFFSLCGYMTALLRSSGYRLLQI